MASLKSLRNAALRARSMLRPESERPPWLEAFERFGVHELTKGKAPKQLDFANDRLYQAYFDKNPQYRQYPLDLNSDSPSPMKLFVLAQAALMEKGHGRKEAYNIVEAEFNKAMGGSPLTASQTALVAAQKHEEAVLQKAVQERREQFGPPANLYSEPVSPAFSFRLPPRQSQQAAPPPSPPSSLQQASQSRTSESQPGTGFTTLPGDVASNQGLDTQHGSQGRVQAEEQGARKNTQNMHQRQVPYQAQNAAPAGFVQFGVEPKGPTE